MEIYFKEDIVGKITDMYKEQFWVHGNFIPSKFYPKYKEFLDAIVCEEGMDETKFTPELFNEKNWTVKTEKGIQGIEIPAIYENGDISIRFR